MKPKYLLHFAHELVPFRWTEFLALTSKNHCNFVLISPPEHIEARPYLIIELDNQRDETKLIQSARGSYLLKGLYELWAQSKISIDDLSDNAGKCIQYLSEAFSGPEETFRVNCESFGSKLSQTTKVDWIRRMIFMETYQSRPNLKSPKQVYCIFEMNEKSAFVKQPKKEYYFGRLLTEGDRDSIHKFSLKERRFIANTSMDPMLSLIATNTARVKPNDVVYDPFVGSGSLLVSAAHKGAYVLGADIDWLLLHGKSRPSRKGETARQPGESVRANLGQYKLEDRYLDVIVSDITRYPFAERLSFDSIISDPPYGIRECSEKIGIRKIRPVKEYKVKYPSKTNYDMRELLRDLLLLSAKHLIVGGRLVYFLPITKNNFVSNLEFIPSHPSLNLISHSEQNLTGKVARLMVVMEKRIEPQPGDEVNIPSIINEMNFRETYFTKSDINHRKQQKAID